MSNHTFTSSYKFFDDLTAHELYAIMRLRSEVFVLEQQCIYQDADNKDLSAYHLMIQDGDTLIAYARLLPPGISYEYMSIGRVISKQDYRRKGAGRLLMKEAIKACHELFGEGPIRIGAQLYLKKFYESFGFVQTGEVYLEDDIEHIEMTRQ
ncbi:MAG: GNAT family N-acetyltransferase [Chitinophagaceae bacterium]|nr:GNAT family N-acetyltransferase [Chitinophagaceae bacterium]MEA3425929.1 GNAT family N-acetyltransferase [Bacteroidota bacterium]MCA6453549.1 GNAT family N-acetyltransferase [Chitinophagaceae bacterium]MCA6455629.1 GNAT family N-acetyltransferase [Chitinophagaceae bacterium]MCA6460630.1 GNAT family N-acetyltransferase [Chitinophagaceae bacterium]